MSLDSSFGDLAGLLDFDDGFDDADGNGLSHVTDGETSKGWVVGESLDAHWLGGNHLDDGSVARFDELGVVLNGLAGTTIDLLQELGEFASDMGGVAVEHWCVTSADLTRVVENNDLGIEGFGTLGWVVLGITSDVASADFLDGDVLDVEANIVTWETLDKLFVVHLNRLNFSGHASGSKSDNHYCRYEYTICKSAGNTYCQP